MRTLRAMRDSGGATAKASPEAEAGLRFQGKAAVLGRPRDATKLLPIRERRSLGDGFRSRVQGPDYRPLTEHFAGRYCASDVSVFSAAVASGSLAAKPLVRTSESLWLKA